MIISKTPLRISFVGGGSDYRSYYERGYGAVISTAIDKYAYVILHPRFDDTVRINYSKSEIVNDIDKLEHGIIREALKLTGIKKGIELTYIGDVQLGTIGTGLGASSSLAVGVLNVLYTYLGQNIDKETLAKQACEIEINKLSRPSGKQDQYAASYGGFNYIRFNKDEVVHLKPVALTNEEKLVFLDHLLLFYTGIATKSDSVLREQESRAKRNIVFLDQMVRFAETADRLISKKDFLGFGELLHQNWLLKKRLADGISNPIIDNAYNCAMTAGSIGGKILGSGGGGFLLFLCEKQKKQQIRQSLAHLRELAFSFDTNGAAIVYNDQ